MASARVEPINKRQSRLHFADGTTADLCVQLHAVRITMHDHDCGSVQFKSLASANSEEVRPLYRMEAIQATPPELQDKLPAIARAALDLFSRYTGARVLPGKSPASLPSTPSHSV